MAVSWTTSPVTQVADVAVNNASRKDAPPGPRVEKGSISKRAPHRISARKPNIMIWAGVTRRYFQNAIALLLNRHALPVVEFINKFIVA